MLFSARWMGDYARPCSLLFLFEKKKSPRWSIMYVIYRGASQKL